jgi:ribosome-binding factor A
MNPDIQSIRIFRELIPEEHQRAETLRLLNTRTGTIRKTLTDGIPEVLARDFYIQPAEE